MALESVTPSSTSTDDADGEVRTYTLDDAGRILDHDMAEWRATRCPSESSWPGIASTLGLASRAATALSGITAMLSRHHLAMGFERDGDVKYVGLNEFYEGCLSEAQGLLIEMVSDALDDVLKSTAS